MCLSGDYYTDMKGACVECPQGADCSKRNGVGLNEIVPRNGYWRFRQNGSMFLDCSQAYSSKSQGEQEARKRCCPKGSCVVNGTTSDTAIAHTNTTVVDGSSYNPDAQCLDGYTGVLCRLCQDGYVDVGHYCKKCEDGPSMVNGLIVCLLICLVVFVMALIFLTNGRCGDKSLKATKNGRTYFGKLVIILSFLQILSATPAVFDSAPWPPVFANFVAPFQLATFDVLSLISIDSCTLSLSFSDRLIVHMLFPVLLAATILLAFAFAGCCIRKNKKLRKGNSNRLYKAFLLCVLLLYPGLATKVFSAFRCTEIMHGDTIITHLLQADPSVVCHSSIEHGSIVLIATVFLILYVVGIPLCILFLLWKNRKHLHDTKHPQHQTARFTLGAVYLQFVSGLLWFFCEFLCFVLLLYCLYENICVISSIHIHMCIIHTCMYVLTFVFLPFFSLSSLSLSL